METSFGKISDIASNAVEVTDSQRVIQTKEMIRNSIDELDLTFHFENGNLVFEEAKLLDIRAGHEVYSSITIPIEGDGYSTISNATF